MADECTVKLVPSGRAFPVREGESVLDAALAHGIALPYSCRGGTCGTCRGRVAAGDFRYPGPVPPGITETESARGDALLCQIRPDTDLTVEVREIEAAGEVEIKRLPARVQRMERAADDVMILRLKLPRVERMQFLAGQYLDVLLREGGRRSFSIANPPHDDELIELHVRRVEGGGFTAHVFEGMQEKALLRIEGPLGTFFLREETERPLLLVAGGTGFAPIKAILRHAFRLGLGEHRHMHLYWGARDEPDLYQHQLVREWQRAQPEFCYTPVLSEPGSGWTGRTGLVHEAVLADHPDLSGFDVYAAGPPAMITAIHERFPEHGADPERLYSDSFDLAPESQAALDASLR